MIGPFESREVAKNVVSYLSTKIVRFLIMLLKTTQHATKQVYEFVPLQDFSHSWSDELIKNKYGISDDEMRFIDSMIRPMELDNE